ncbi:sterile alpha motif domain-containing protein 3 [Perca flavescens]|uniref:sterile alpha motif domain-containing protein 3 n=1 Tax=Perca flavescens TaxID=8167 RepID=UPI00106E4DC3|nr:sterile alpha motif domain-containing protein 3 [Perca flavescens]
MALIKMFPTNDDYVKVCKALILKYPFLKDKEGNGYHTWHMSLKRKFKYERLPLIDDEEVRRMKLKFGHHKKPLQHKENTSKRAKTSKEVDIIGEDDTSVASHVKVLQDQYRKTQPDARMVEERMMRTFAWRRREIANGMTVEEAINKYPFLKSPCGETVVGEEEQGPSDAVNPPEPPEMNELVAVIRSASEASQWRYVNGYMNPADCVSRGITASRFMRDEVWLSGPEFLRLPEPQWPKVPDLCLTASDPDVKVLAVTVTTKEDCTDTVNKLLTY